MGGYTIGKKLVGLWQERYRLICNNVNNLKNFPNPSTPTTTKAIVNSGTTSYFLTTATAKLVGTNPNLTTKVAAKIPDGRLVLSEGETMLNLPSFPTKANKAKILTDLTESLFSVPQVTQENIDV